MIRVPLAAHGATVQLDVDPGDHIGARIARGRDWYERDLLEDLRHRVRRGRTAVDVGAHIGNHTSWLAAVCGLHVVALEPSPQARAQLLRNVFLSRLGEQVDVICAAAGAENGRAVMQAGPAGNTGMARAAADPSGDVRVLTIDSLGLTDVGLIKIDVEGGELDVLRGALNTIRRDRPVLYVETAADRLPDVDALLAPLRYARFGRYAITPTYGYAPTEHGQVRLSAAIMAHPSRQHFVHQLEDDLDGPARVVWDRHNDRWDTGRRALLAHDPEATHHLVIQDDVQPCRDLLAGCTELLAHVPAGHPVALYMGRTRTAPRFSMGHVVEAAQRKAAFAAFEGPWWGQAVILPTSTVPAVVAFGDTHPQITNYDHRIAWYFNSIRMACYYTMPSLVEHRTGPENPSLLDHGNGEGRRAAWRIGDGEAATGIDWGRGVVTPADLPPRLRGAFPSTPSYPGLRGYAGRQPLVVGRAS
ncbi:FkbM family methyltransferase [Streptomyces sp. NRRL B-1347]|uniref:FkbM family methyltransferase n=1 Tax=Streptomyces sp. NRRL B-1347 TaxID=1476877 RepID=UPI0006922E8B|nr:FkbM family methyltransferase [Streptomyces sp. NRRL B-1347]